MATQSMWQNPSSSLCVFQPLCQHHNSPTTMHTSPLPAPDSMGCTSTSALERW